VDDRIEKLLALAQRGVGGERVNARRILERELAKRGLTLEDLLEADAAEEPVREGYSYRSAHDRELLFACIRYVLQRDKVRYQFARKNRTRIFLTLSPAKHAQVAYVYSILRAALKAEIADLTLAFIYRQGLWAHLLTGDESECDESPEAERRGRKIAELSQLVGVTTLRRALTGG